MISSEHFNNLKDKSVKFDTTEPFNGHRESRQDGRIGTGGRSTMDILVSPRHLRERRFPRRQNLSLVILVQSHVLCSPCSSPKDQAIRAFGLGIAERRPAQLAIIVFLTQWSLPEWHLCVQDVVVIRHSQAVQQGRCPLLRRAKK